MKLLTPCCQVQQDYNPKKKWNGKNRRTTTCRKCKKSFDINEHTIIHEETEDNMKSTKTKVSLKALNMPSTVGGVEPPTNPLLDPNLFSNVNIKTLLKNDSIMEILDNGRNKSKAYDVLTKAEFIEQGEIKHGVYWTSDIKPYQRPSFIFPWQSVGIDLMEAGHCMWQASRQKIGKTTGAFNADFEDMLMTPGTVVTLVAPGMEQATVLLRQGFKEVLTLEDGRKFDLWSQLYEPYFIVDNVKKMVMKNGSLLQVIPLSEYTTPGYATDILHIEELDKIVKDPQKLRGLGAVLPTIRARRGYAKLRITCNNTAGVYRILREDLKDLYPYLTIYMEKPRPLNSKFTGEHHIYNEMYNCPEKPDIDIILQRIMDCVMGQDYTKMQLGNVDDYSGDVFNPDKLDAAYKRGREFIPRKAYDNCLMGIDPGAIHAFAITIYGREGLRIYHLWTGRFSVSGTDPTEQENMLKKIAKIAAQVYVIYHCQGIASESNSGAKLIIPLINKYIRKEIVKVSGQTYAKAAPPIWSNFGADKEKGNPDAHAIPRVDFITLMQYLFNYNMITLQDTNEDEHFQRIEFARYHPDESKEKYKGDCVDASMHACWHLCGGYDYIKLLIKETDKTGGVILL